MEVINDRSEIIKRIKNIILRNNQKEVKNMARKKVIDNLDDLTAGFLNLKGKLTGLELKDLIEDLPDYKNADLNPRTYQESLRRVKPVIEDFQEVWGKPWSLGVLGKYDLLLPGIISNSDLPAIQKMSYYRNGLDQDYTIRDAVWTARLSHLIPDDTALLSSYVYFYTLTELIARISNTEFDTSMLDFAISNGINNMPTSILIQLSQSAPDDCKIVVSKAWSKSIEIELLGYEIEGPCKNELTGQAYLGYVNWLSIFYSDDNFKALKQKEKESIINNLLDYWWIDSNEKLKKEWSKRNKMEHGFILDLKKYKLDYHIELMLKASKIIKAGEK
jgi:hypothetical protein